VGQCVKKTWITAAEMVPPARFQRATFRLGGGRILTREEEVKLLAACETPQRSHLRAILLCALDTGMRQGEIFSLRWRDVDLENGLLNIQAFHTKTMKERQIAITTRLALELERLKASAPTMRMVWYSAFSTTSNEVSRQHELKPD
jgi:integrase